MPRVALHTLGCKLNYAETASLTRQFLDRGFELVEFGQPADVCLINTCTVTRRADSECRQMIRRALRTSPHPFVIVTGCYAQLEPEEVASIAGVDVVLGAREKFELFTHVRDFTKGAAPRVLVSDIDTVDSFGAAASAEGADRTRAFLKVQDGCDYTCSFCTIPLARGASRSQSIEACLSQARDIIGQGYKEIVLTGVNVGDYGHAAGGGLPDLLRVLAGVEGLERIRISSVEPNLFTEELLELAASNPKICRHFHIPLQSGDDEMLRRMRRRYTALDYARLVGRIRRVLPDCGIGVDVIVGFPGETRQHFERTHEFLRDLDVSYLHVFTYSERPDTPAAAMAGQVPVQDRQERNRMLRILGQKKRLAFYQGLVGSTLEVLTEGTVEEGLRYGLTSNYARVGIPAEGVGENVLLPVTILSTDGDLCRGRPAGRSSGEG